MFSKKKRSANKKASKTKRFPVFMTIACLIFLAFLAVSYFRPGSCTDGDAQKNDFPEIPHASYDKDIAPEDMPLARKAFNIFMEESGPLFREYIGDIGSISISVDNPARWRHPATKMELKKSADIRMEEYGWYIIVEVKVNLKEDTNRIPFQYRPWGHTLTYEMGGGSRRPGILSRKSLEQLVCGWPDYHGSNYVRDVPELQFIPGLE